MFEGLFPLWAGISIVSIFVITLYIRQGMSLQYAEISKDIYKNSHTRRLFILGYAEIYNKLKITCIVFSR